MMKAEYKRIARAAAQVAVKKVPYPAGGLIENEIHNHLVEKVGMDPESDLIFNVADHALEIAGILLGVGPDTL
jgi:hypothetical protein|tara:strand:- start:87 stop:305 length:219 start_codon:yes stop_codon:yes gene_type:complete